MGRRGANIVVGLDMGTTKISAIIGEIQSDGMIDIIGVGSHPSRGLKKGVVVNIDSTVESIYRAVREAQIMAGVDVDAVYVGIAGGHIAGINSTGIVTVKNQEITARDIDKVLDAAHAVALPVDREVIHILPQEYAVDGEWGIFDPPLGMSGGRLEAKVHIVTAAVASAHNIIKSVNKAGLEVEDIVLEQLAASESVLSPAERDLGVVIVDIGGGTTNIALLSESSLKHTAVLTVGGNHITSDLAYGLNLPLLDAEQLKKTHGCAFSPRLSGHETVDFQISGESLPQRFTRLELCDIIEPRVEELFQLVYQEILRSGYTDNMIANIVLTGGTALLDGVVDLAEEVFQCPVRCGEPQGVMGLVDLVKSPMYATGVGLLLYGAKQYYYGSQQKFTGEFLFSKIYHRMRDWFNEFLLA